MRILALDQGTSATKALVVDERRVVAESELPLRPDYLDGGGVTQDPQALWDSVTQVGADALAKAGGVIDGIALANQGESVLVWDRASGTPLSPVIGWQDRRAETVTGALNDRAEEIARRTGLALDPYFSAPKMTWLRAQTGPQGVVTTTDTWLVHRLTGEYVTDVTTASRSLVTSLDTTTWDDELAALFGLTPADLPRIVSCDEVVGVTRTFGREVPLAALMVDQQAALLAQGCLGVGDAKCTFGTGAFLLANAGPDPVRSASGLTTSVAWRLRAATSYALDGQAYTVASAIRWLVDLGLLAAPDEVDAAAADSGGAIFVPALAGLAAPRWRPDATGSFTGLTLATRPGHLVRAVLDGIACLVAELVDTVGRDTGRPLEQLRVDGGVTRSGVLMQAVADFARVPVWVAPAPHASALGVAAAAVLALDLSTDVHTVVGSTTPAKVYEPHLSADEAAATRGRWAEAVSHA